MVQSHLHPVNASFRITLIYTVHLCGPWPAAIQNIKRTQELAQQARNPLETADPEPIRLWRDATLDFLASMISV